MLQYQYGHKQTHNIYYLYSNIYSFVSSILIHIYFYPLYTTHINNYLLVNMGLFIDGLNYLFFGLIISLLILVSSTIITILGGKFYHLSIHACVGIILGNIFTEILLDIVMGM